MVKGQYGPRLRIAWPEKLHIEDQRRPFKQLHQKDISKQVPETRDDLLLPKRYVVR